MPRIVTTSPKRNRRPTAIHFARGNKLEGAISLGAAVRPAPKANCRIRCFSLFIVNDTVSDIRFDRTEGFFVTLDGD